MALMFHLYEELLDRLHSALHQRNRPSLRARQFQFERNPQTLVNSRRHLRRIRRTVLRRRPNIVRRPDHLPALDPSARHNNAPALRPMVAPARLSRGPASRPPPYPPPPPPPPPPFPPPPRHNNAPALRPMVAPARRIHLRRASELAHRQHHRIRQ